MRTIAAALLLMLLSGPSWAAPPLTYEWEVSGWGFLNYCTGFGVRPWPGETIRAVVKLDPTDGQVHLVNQAAGSVAGYGVSGGEYRVTLMMNPLALAPEYVVWNSAQLNTDDPDHYTGTVTARGRTNIVGEGQVSMADFFLKFNLKDGVATLVRSDPTEGYCIQQ